MSEITDKSVTRLKRIGNYQFGKEIGKGSFATVYKCINLKTNQQVAIKSVVRSKLKSKKLIANLEIEVSILKNMKHPHIVGLLDYDQTESHFHLVMDYCSMGDLSYFIRKRNQLLKTHPVINNLLERYPSIEGSHGLNKILVIHFLKQLSSALEFLRDKSLVHRDIKPQNLLLCPPLHSKKQFEDGKFVGLWDLPILKIADFGFARFLPSTSMAETLCGSPLYMAPEILRYEKYNAKADLWSVGAVLYEMSVGKPPFKASNHIELLKNIEKSNDEIKFPSSAKVSESLKKLIKSLLKYNPTERISFNEFFNDPLITNDLEIMNNNNNIKPLEASIIDENLFILEYISPLPKIEGPIENKSNQLVKNIGITDEKSLNMKSIHRSTERDEEIKKIINKNSPDPENLLNSINNNNTNANANAGKIENIESSRKSSTVSPTSHSKVIDNDTNKLVIKNKTNDDIFLEKDYVVVEKRVVEVNAIADELAKAGSGAVAINPRRSSSTSSGNSVDSNHSIKPNHSPYFRRYSNSNSNPNSNPTSSSGNANSNTNSNRRSSFDRRISISISPTNALSKAIGLASNRLFGYNLNQLDNSKIDENNNGEIFSNFTSPNFSNNLLLNKVQNQSALQPGSMIQSNSNNTINSVNNSTAIAKNANITTNSMGSKTLTNDEIVLIKLESIATKAHAINLFADVKFSQLIPSPPSSDDLDDDLVHQNDLLPPKIIKTISEEGVVLYVKTLSLLAKGMTIASEWWYNQVENDLNHSISNINIDNENKDNNNNGNSASSANSKDLRIISTSNNLNIAKINELVQWIRDKFNECLEKAEFIKLRLQEVENLNEENDESQTQTQTQSDLQNSKIIAEKLIFDRALEISRNAAVNELVKEDLKGCELSYSTAIWMLEALLDEDFNDNSTKLDDEDKRMIEKFVVSIGNRLSVLKRKLDLN